MAITFVEAVPSNANSAGHVAFSASGISVGELLVVYVEIPGTYSSVQPLTFTDNYNSGNWTTLVNYYDNSGNQRQQSLAYIKCNASSAGVGPTVSCSFLNAVSSNWIIGHYNGFLGTATPVAGNLTNTGTTGFNSSTAVAATSFNTSQPNELVCAFGGSASSTSWGTAPSGWSQRGVFNASDYLYDQIVSTSSSAIQFTGTLSGADAWYVTQAGFYDSTSGAGIPIAWVT